jgi:hypothetical protein
MAVYSLMRLAPPLSERERSALYRILASSTRGRPNLEPRQRAALDAYAEIIASPPLEELAVVHAARAVIRVWADLNVAAKAPQKRRYFPAVLLDPEEDPADSPFNELANDLWNPGIVEAATEIVAASPLLYDLSPDRPTEALSFRSAVR